MKTNHSKGPWSIGDKSEDGCFTDIDAVGHGSIAIVVTRMEDDKEDLPSGIANLHLIATAPELLKAAERILATREISECPDGRWSTADGDHYAARIALEHAIAKSKGR